VVRLPIPPLTEKGGSSWRRESGISRSRPGGREAGPARRERPAEDAAQKKEISEDDEKDGLKKVQDLTNDFIGKVTPPEEERDRDPRNLMIDWLLEHFRS